ncbi:MAG: YncE family protein [Bacteroidales bacterium]|jgi:DNA-binding beta-propeller fold protein YncE|nr:YncE family protein [Bacteroidales bacterium]
MTVTPNKHIAVLLLCVAAAACMQACRKGEEPAAQPTVTAVAPAAPGEEPIKGFFLLNEGNMGSNKATLDWFDYETGQYSKNIFAQRNPGVVKELGDVGNDIQIYGGKLYAVINCSHLVEVMDAGTARHIATIPIPNCRYITFSGGHAYVSSYAGKVQADPGARLGYVAKIDTALLAVVGECSVGWLPEEMAVRGGRLYVANSGGYRVPHYDSTVSVIDLNTFEEVKKITVAINLHRMEPDSHGNIWVTSRGDYGGAGAGIYIIDGNDAVSSLQLPVGNMALCGDSLYTCGTVWNHATGSSTASFAIINTLTKSVVSNSFITDGTGAAMQTPYGIAVNPDTREIYVTDAKNHVTPGTLYCFAPGGTKRWEVTTGDIPAHIVFTRKKLI